MTMHLCLFVCLLINYNDAFDRTNVMASINVRKRINVHTMGTSRPSLAGQCPPIKKGPDPIPYPHRHPPKTPAQTAGYVGPSNVLRSASDQQGIASYRMSMEAAEEQVQCMERSTSGNVRPAASTRPPKRPTQTASHAGISMGTPRVAVLV